MTFWLSIFLGCSTLFVAQKQEGETYIRWLLKDLESEDPTTRKSSYTALLAEEGSLHLIMQKFSSASSLSRQLRAKLLLEKGSAEWVSQALDLLEDPDPQVRSYLLQFLLRPEISFACGTPCVQAWQKICDSPQLDLCQLALEGLQTSESPDAATALLIIFRRNLEPRVRQAALGALLNRFHSTPQLLELAKNPGVDRSYVAQVLLELGNRAVPSAVEIFHSYFSDSDAQLRKASRQAFLLLQSQLVRRREFAKAADNYRAVQSAVSEFPNLLFEEAQFHILHSGDLQRAKIAAQKFVEQFASELVQDSFLASVQASLLIGQVELLSKRPVEAHAAFAASLSQLEKLWLQINPQQDPQTAFQLISMQAKAHILCAVNGIIFPQAVDCHPEKELSAAYDLSTKAKEFRDRWFALLYEEKQDWVFQFDDFLYASFGLYPFVQYAILREFGDETAQKIWLQVANHLAKKFPGEFVPLPPEPISQSVESPEVRLRVPSRLPLIIADFYNRILGHPDQALEIYQRIAKQWRLSLNAYPWLAEQIADVEMAMASIFMDHHDGKATKEALLRGIGLLEDLRRWNEARFGLDNNRDAQIQMRLAAFYVSLAVNENVVEKQPEQAREYLELAYSMDSSIFNRVLLACYYARAGDKTKALALIANVELEPALYYNLACTHALLGNKEQALAYLRQHFHYFDPVAKGEKETSQAWAWQDPDLESLREEAEFRKLVGKE